MLQLISLAVLISTLHELFIMNLQLRNISFYVFWSSLYFISLMQTLRVSLKWIIYIFLLFGLLFLLKWIWLINNIYVALISFIVVRGDFLMDWASFVLLCLWWSPCKHRLLLQIINWSLWVHRLVSAFSLVKPFFHNWIVLMREIGSFCEFIHVWPVNLILVKKVINFFQNNSSSNLLLILLIRFLI